MKQNLPLNSMRWRAAYKTYVLLVLSLLLCGLVTAQPTMISEIPNASKSFVNVNGTLYFAAGDNLYKGNSSSAPVLVKTTGQSILQIYKFALGNNFFFVTQTGAGQALWRSNGTAAGTVQVATNSQITPLLVSNSTLFLKVNSPDTGIELWKMDAGFNVSIVKDINPGAANGFLGSLIEHNGLVYFFATAGSGQDLWRTDGTSPGTLLAVDLDDEGLYNFSGFYGLTSVGPVMFFTWHYEGSFEYGDIWSELWKTDGTQANTVRVKQWTGGFYYNNLSHLLAFNGKLYFFHNIGDPIYTYFSVSDGTTAGTNHIDLVTIDGGPRQLIAADDYMLYYGESQGNTTSIEKSDGGPPTTVHGFSYYHSTSDVNIQLTAAGDRAFFLDDIGEYFSGDRELWQADLSTGVTTSLSEKYGVSYNQSGNIVADNGNIYFTRLIFGNLTLWYYNPDGSPTPTECATAGFIEREKWNEIAGTTVNLVPVNEQPDEISVLSNFSSPRNEGSNYGARIRGYICAPESGNYVFYISSDDNSELWLSTDDNPDNKQLIASSKYTAYNEWTKYPTQTSAEIALVQGHKYYIEALHKEASGLDHLAVGWKLPDGTLERPIAGTRLSPFERNQPPIVIITQPADGATYTAPATIDITAFPRDPDGSIVKVGFYNAGTLLGEATAYPYTYRWNNVAAGTYTIEARALDNGGYVSSDFQTVTVSPGCSGTGNIVQEIWTNVTGTDVRTFNFSSTPNTSRSFSSFETTQYYANNFASRMRGYLCVPQTGNYTLWISSDDYSELYLSTDENESNKTLIAWVYGATQFRNYDKYASQKSVPVTLVAGHSYYIEARHKEGNGNDFISVGWQLPDGTMERPIAGNRLIAIDPNQNNPTPCAGTGTLVREIWTGITGTSVSQIPVNSPPNKTVTLTSFATPNYYGNDYGSRIRGYICAPATGGYTFWISGDDNSELWLSTNDDPSTKRRIAYVTTNTAVNQWDKYDTQVSNGTIDLVQGQRYYVEVLHKEANGADHVEVGWMLPSGVAERPIPGNRLIPFEDASTSAASFVTNEVFSEVPGSEMSVYPNPVVSGKTVTISLPEVNEGDVQVDVISATGGALQTEQHTVTAESVTMQLKPSIVPGMYLIKVFNSRKRWVSKIQVK